MSISSLFLFFLSVSLRGRHAHATCTCNMHMQSLWLSLSFFHTTKDTSNTAEHFHPHMFLSGSLFMSLFAGDMQGDVGGCREKHVALTGEHFHPRMLLSVLLLPARVSLFVSSVRKVMQRDPETSLILSFCASFHIFVAKRHEERLRKKHVSSWVFLD